MRFVPLLLLAAVVCQAQFTFTDGQAARLVIGQRTFTSQDPGATSELLGAVSGLAYANDMLVVVDSNRLGATPVNHRVLLFKGLSAMLPDPTARLEFTKRCPVCVGTASVVLGQPDFEKAELKPASETTLREPAAAATDGTRLVIADTNNNRVLIWSTIPSTNDRPADLVLGQPDFKRVIPNEGQQFTPTNRSFKGPQGVWIQAGKLFLADASNNRVLIWNSFPTSNYQPADVVLGQPDFNTFVQPDLTKEIPDAKATTMNTPVSVTSDGQRLFVTDLGHNRVLVWNSIPTRNQQPADLVLGQPDMESALANNSSKLCEPTGQKDDEGNDIYPDQCKATMDFPRFALSDGRYLFIADGGNDRILVYNTMPARNGQPADVILGQLTPLFNLISDSADPNGIASAGAVRTPMSLAFDGRNLYASDPFNRRVMVFTAAERKVPNTGVRNSASREVFAIGAVTLSGEIVADRTVFIRIGTGDAEREYSYKTVENDTFNFIVNGLVSQVNEANNGQGDPEVIATPNLTLAAVILTARVGGAAGNEVALATEVTGGTEIQAATTGATLQGGQDAAKIAPGTIVSILGEDLAETSVGVPPATGDLPLELGGVQVYFDGIRAPLFSVSPTEIRAQVPWEVLDSQSINAYVRTQRSSGDVSVTSAIAVPIIPQNPGIYAVEGVADPRPGIVMHGSDFATGTVSVDGSIQAGNIATVRIEDRAYTYTVKEGDTLESVRDGLIAVLNQDPVIEASPAGAFTRIRLRARKAGPEGNGIVYSGNTREGDAVIITATTPALCCANRKYSLVTPNNPAQPGETIIVYATGLGLVQPDAARRSQKTGLAYAGPELNDPVEFVSSLSGGKTANVLSAGMRPGAIGLYEVVLELNSDMPTNSATQLTIAQDIYVSNIVTFPLFNPNQENTTP
jgi:uncharacterized protein (TIGR03437 family)